MCTAVVREAMTGDSQFRFSDVFKYVQTWCSHSEGDRDPHSYLFSLSKCSRQILTRSPFWPTITFTLSHTQPVPRPGMRKPIRHTCSSSLSMMTSWASTSWQAVTESFQVRWDSEKK